MSESLRVRVGDVSMCCEQSSHLFLRLVQAPSAISNAAIMRAVKNGEPVLKKDLTERADFGIGS